MAVLAVALAALIPASTAKSHSLDIGAAITHTVCVGSNSSKDDKLYNDTGPTDRTHYMRFGIGLQNNDQTQSAWFDFFIIDNAITAEVGTFRGSGRNWIEVGQYTKWATVATHVGGGFDAHVVIHNEDSQSECFMVFARRQTA